MDPRVRYDRTTGRFILIGIDTGENNQIYVAVSSSGTINASTTFTFFTFNQGVSGSPGTFADYPTVGVDRNAIYIGTNDFTEASGYRGSTAYVVRKSSVLGSGPLVVTGFAGVNASTTVGPGLVTPQGVDNDDPDSNEGYFVTTSSRSFGELGLLRVTYTRRHPEPRPERKDHRSHHHERAERPANGFDPEARLRRRPPHAREDLLRREHRHPYPLDLAQLLRERNWRRGGGSARVGSRWYQIKGFASGGTPSLVQDGTVLEPSDTTGYFIPSVVQSLQGHALLGSSIASPNLFGSATSSYRLADDPLGTMRRDLCAKDGTSSYPGNRWGDYSMATVDPADGRSFWSFQEYAEDGGGRVWAQKILAPSPTASIAGVSLRRGQTKTLSISGTGFFDPPASCPNHFAASTLTASILMATYLNPTSATIRFRANADAPLGARPLTMTNPDGQSADSSFEILPVLLCGTICLGGYTARPSPLVDVEIVDAIGNVVQMSSFRPANDGTISFEPTVAAGVYSIRLRSAHFLRRVLKNVDLSEGEATISTLLVNGDVNNDNVVSIADANALRSPLGSNPSNPNWNPSADLNGDGVVSIADGNILRASLGQQGD